MTTLLKNMLPFRLQMLLVRSPLFFRLRCRLVRLFGRRPAFSETAKTRSRREREDFFSLFCRGRGLDIGYGGDLVCANACGWDIEDGDAMHLKGLADACFDFVYSSHTLEHMVDLDTALQNWWRVLKPGGYLILYVPHRDLYEKQSELPSRWNLDHKHYFLPETDEPPVTVGLLPLLTRTLSSMELVYLKVCAEGHTITRPDRHSDGEYSIEAVVRKPC